MADGKRKGWRSKDDHLSAKERQGMPSSDFALPGKGNGPKGAGAGSYPIPDRSHARNALARASQNASPSDAAKIRAAVHRKFPTIGEKAAHRYRDRKG